MARTFSNMLPLGTKAPDFNLLDTVSDQFKTLQALKGTKGTVILFICNHCPFVKHVNAQLAQLAIDYASKSINCIAISSNDIDAYPQDAPIYMKQNALAEGFRFPYLFDATQEVARSYEAACTPDFYVFNADLHLVYRGQLDASRPGNGIPVTGKDLRNALDNMLNNKAISAFQKPSIGCGIKWRTTSI